MFVPTNEAYYSFPVNVREWAKIHMQNIFTGNIVNGRVYSTQLRNELTIPTIMKWKNADVKLRINMYHDGQVSYSSFYSNFHSRASIL